MDVFDVPVPNHGSTHFPALLAREAARCRGAAALRVGWLVAAMTILGCPGGSSPQVSPTDPIVSLAAEPSELRPGESVTLRPVFTAGDGRIEPGIGPVISGGAYAVGPFSTAVTFRLVVDLPSSFFSRELRVPFRYRGRVASLTPGAARAHHGTARLSDGRILIVGGDSPHSVSWWDSEVFDPVTGLFTPAGQLSSTRTATAVVALPAGGALRIGGSTNEVGYEIMTRVEEWDPAKRTWSITGHLASARRTLTATRFPDGRVLVAGGGEIDVPGSEVWVPGTGSRPPAGDMVDRRSLHTATLLADGRVLIAGGLGASGSAAAQAEVFDPATETFAPTGSLVEARYGHAAVLLPDGRVLVLGGLNTPDASVLPSAELWDPATGQFTRTGDLATPREGPVAVLLGSGEVLVAGGLVSRASAVADLEIWDPATGAFRSAAAALPGPRAGLSAHLLDDARVLLVGGEPGNEFPVAGAFLFE